MDKKSREEAKESHFCNSLTPELICKTFDSCVITVLEHDYFKPEKKTKLKGGKYRIFPSDKQYEMARWMTDHILTAWRG